MLQRSSGHVGPNSMLYSRLCVSVIGIGWVGREKGWRVVTEGNQLSFTHSVGIVTDPESVCDWSYHLKLLPRPDFLDR